MAYYLAIDIGTESARAGVFDDSGRRLAEAGSGYTTSYPKAGWAEQNPCDWWKAAVEASRAAMRTADVDTIAAMGVATTASTVVFLDALDQPLRPAILWMDGRAGNESTDTAHTGHPALRYSGGSDSSEWLVPKAMWVARHEPDTYRSARRIGESVDYLTLRLTGHWVGSRLNATCKWNYDHREGGLPEDLYRLLGVPGLVDKLPSEILPAGAPIGLMTGAVAAEFGIINRPLVVTGGIDAHLALVSLSGLSANPVAVVAGTSNAFIAELDEPVFSPTIWGPYPGALSEGRWLVEGGQVSAGSALSWLSERILGIPRDQLPELVARAAAVPAVLHGVLVADHFMGNRTPLRDPDLRGTILGLSLGTTTEQLYRATVEAVCYGTKQVLDSFTQVGVNTSEVFLTGGIRHNSLWLQTTVDVLGRPVQLVSNENLTIRAMAILAAAAATGVDRREVAVTFAPSSETIEPHAESSSAFDEGYQNYLDAVTATAELSHRLVALTTRQQSAGAPA